MYTNLTPLMTGSKKETVIGYIDLSTVIALVDDDNENHYVVFGCGVKTKVDYDTYCQIRDGLTYRIGLQEAAHSKL